MGGKSTASRTRNGEEGRFKPIDEISPKFRRGVVRDSYSSDELETTLCYHLQYFEAGIASGMHNSVTLDVKAGMQDHGFQRQNLKTYEGRRAYALKVMREYFGEDFGKE